MVQTATLQSIRFNKTEWTKVKAIDWLRKNNFKTSVKPNPQYKNYIAFRQVQPEKFYKDSFRTKKLKNGIMMIVGNRKS